MDLHSHRSRLPDFSIRFLSGINDRLYVPETQPPDHLFLPYAMAPPLRLRP